MNVCVGGGVCVHDARVCATHLGWSCSVRLPQLRHDRCGTHRGVVMPNEKQQQQQQLHRTTRGSTCSVETEKTCANDDKAQAHQACKAVSSEVD